MKPVTIGDCRTGGAVLKTILLRRKRRRIDRSRCEAVGRKGPPRDRRPIAGTGDRKRSGGAIRDRPSTRLGTAVKPATLHGASVAGYRRDRRGFQRARHSYLVTSASRNPRLSRLRLSSSPRRSPAPLGPHGLRDRRAERHHGQKPWTSAVPLSSRVPCVRAGGTRNRERHLPTSVDVTGAVCDCA